MGYDIYTERPDAEQVERAAEARKALDAIDVGCVEWSAAYERFLEALEGSYFRTNIWGMGHLREVMHSLGMLAPAVQTTFPKPEEFGLTSQEVWDAEGSDEEPSDAVRAYREAVEAQLSAESHDSPGIAVNKLSSNDGWLVTENECRSAVGIWDRVRADDPHRACAIGSEAGSGEFWAEWISYLRTAATHGGCRVC